MNVATSLLNEILGKTTPQNLAGSLGLNVGTIKRWVEQQRMPVSYCRDLCRLLGRAEYPVGSERDKDQFYTLNSVASNCLSHFYKVAKELSINTREYTFIEPSAGAGAFYNLLPISQRIGMDIEPNAAEIITADYLTWEPKRAGKYIVIGNPPFGLRGHLALQFINHSAKFADMVAFILPQLFNSDGKGVPAKRVKEYTLAHSSQLKKESFIYPDNTPVDVEAIFQIWTRIKTDKINRPKPKTCRQFIKVYSLSDGGTPSSTRNKNMLYACDVYLPSTCFTGMRAYSHFEKLPHRRGYGIAIHQCKGRIKHLLRTADWENIAFRSTNGALNLRTGIIESVLTGHGYADT